MKKAKYITISDEELQKLIDQANFEYYAFTELKILRDAKATAYKTRALTVKEVLEMNSKPVWIKVFWYSEELVGIEDGWVALEVDCDKIIVRRFGCSEPDYLKLEDYGKTWFAYTDCPESDK